MNDRRSEFLSGKYGSLSDARGYAAELAYAIDHPEEDDISPEQVASMKNQLAEIKEYLALSDEAL